MRAVVDDVYRRHRGVISPETLLSPPSMPNTLRKKVIVREVLISARSTAPAASPREGAWTLRSAEAFFGDIEGGDFTEGFVLRLAADCSA